MCVNSKDRYGVGCSLDKKLEARLLSFGGTKVIPQPQTFVELLLERGQVFEVKGRKHLHGDLHACHRNSALHYAKHHILGYAGTFQIVTGYCLSDDCWWQHSWLWDGKRVVETNVRPKRYFGVILNPREALKFVFLNVLAVLPGFAELEQAG